MDVMSISSLKDDQLIKKKEEQDRVKYLLDTNLMQGFLKMII